MVLGMKIKTFLTLRCVSPLNFSILVDAGPLHSPKMKFSITDFLSKCDQIRSFLWIWSHLPMKSLIENFIFCAVLLTTVRGVFRTLSNMYDGVFLQNSSSFQPLTISEKSAISYVWQGSKYASDCAFFKC